MTQTAALRGKRLTIFIACRDRVDYAREAIGSALRQDYPSVRVVVSDNSEGDEVEGLVRTEFREVAYIRRRPPTGGLEHLNRILSEAASEFLVVFHDDDVLMPDYARTMVEILDRDSSAAAVGCNAWVLEGNEATGRLFNKIIPASISDCLRGTTSQLHARDLAEKYFSVRGGTMPFPGYMFRTSLTRSLRLEPQEGGKYADVAFLIKAASAGWLLWTYAPLMHYRFHGANDSGREEVCDRLALLRFVIGRQLLGRESLAVREFRFKFWLRWWLAKEDRRHRKFRWRRNIVVRFLIESAIYMLVSDRKLWRRILR